jgi:mono/diheme cytochrome c family protein
MNVAARMAIAILKRYVEGHLHAKIEIAYDQCDAMAVGLRRAARHRLWLILLQPIGYATQSDFWQRRGRIETETRPRPRQFKRHCISARLHSAHTTKQRVDQSAKGASNMQCQETKKSLRVAFCLTFSAAIAAMGAWPSCGQSPPPPPASGPDIDYWQPLWMQRQLWGPGKMPPGMRARMLRHMTYMQYGVQKEYQGAQSTVGSAQEVIVAGRELYVKNCATCHGMKGMGDGNASNSLLPSPALLAFMIQRPISVDEYLLWSISEGGKDFSTDMPAFKDTLSRNEIWTIVAYMRAGFPDAPN